MKIKKLFALSFVAVGITALASCGDKQFTEEDVNNKVNEAVDKANQEAEAQKNAALAEKEAALKKAALDELKTTAKTNVDSYKVNVLAVAGITDVENEDIAAAVSTAKTAIEAATTNEEVATAYKNGIDSIKAVIAEILEGIQADLDEEAKILAAQLSNAKLTAISDISKFNSAENYYVNTKDDGTVSNLISVATTAINAAGSLESIEALKTQTKNAMAETFLALFEASFVEISTAEELFAIRNQYNDNSVIAHNYRLTKDIDLSGFEIPTYEVASFFKGVFDGQGHVISNGSYTAGDSKEGMLFKTVLGESTIKNVKFLNCVATSTNETVAIIAGECNDGEVTFDGIEFNSCAAVTSGNYVGLIFGRNEGKAVQATIKNITLKNSSYVSCAQYGGLLVGDIIKNASVDFENLDITGTLKKSSGNGAMLAGRTRKGSSVSVKNAVLDVTSDTPAKIAIVGGGSESLTNLTVENVVIKNTNMNKLTYTAPTNYQISNLHFVSSETITNLVLKDTAVEAATVESSAITPTWLKDTLKLDFENSWVTEGVENAKYRLAKASTNVKGANAVLTSIKLNADNATKRFKNGTDFSYEGLLVTGVYNDGVQLVLSAGVDYTVDSTAYNKTASGDYIIRINANPDGEDVLALKGEYTVKVATQTGIKINTEFANKTYYLGSKLDTSEVVVYSTWDDDITERLSGAKIDTKNYDSSKAGEYEIIISSGDYNLSYNVNVIDTKPVVVDNIVFVRVDDSLTETHYHNEGIEHFKTLSSAIDYLASCNYDENVTKVIYVADGTYNEKITVPASLTNLKLIGQSQANTVITYSAVESTIDPVTGAAYGLNKVDCATVHVDATGFGASNITIRNDFDYINDNKKESSPQGLALTINGDQAVLNNVYLYGNQDTLYIKSGRLYVKGGKIDGNIDFIFGNANGLAFFDATTITAISRDGTGAATNTGYVTAMKATAEDKPDYGYIFNNCTFTRGENVAVGSMSLGRPWGPAATVAYINCNFDSTYSTLDYNGSAKSRWFDMSGNSPVNADFCEYGSTGAGAITEAVNGGKVLTAEQAANYTMANIFAATNGKCKWSAAWDATAALKALNDVAIEKVGAAEATGVTASEKTIEINKDDSTYLYLATTPWNAFNNGITYEIEDDSIISFDGKKITGLKIGKTKITVKKGEFSYEVAVTVKSGLNIINKEYNYLATDTTTTWTTVADKDSDISTCNIGNAENVTCDSSAAGYDANNLTTVKKFGAATAVLKSPTLTDAVKEVKVKVLIGSTATSNPLKLTINGYDASGNVVATTYGYYAGKKLTRYLTTAADGTDTELTLTSTTADIAYITIGNSVQQSDGTTFKHFGVLSASVYYSKTEVYVEDTSISENTEIVLGTNNEDLVALCTDNVIQGKKVELGKVTIDATNGKLRLNGGDNAQVNTGTIITFKVKAGATVTVVGYPGLFAYSLDGVAATTAETSKTYTQDATVTIIATDNQYIKSIKVVYPAVIDTNTSIVLGTNNEDLVALCTDNVIQGKKVELGKITIDATNGKLRLNGGDNAQVNTGTIITFNVKAGAKVTVCGYPGLFAYNLDGVAATSVDTEKTYSSDATVTILATDNQYLKTIKVEYPA